MGYLRELLCVMTPDEIEQIKEYEWKGNERTVILHLCKYRSNENAEQEIFESHQFSRSYADKITSVLYGKCLELVGTDSIIEQLAFLGRRHLHTHIYHELKINERKIDSGKIEIDKSYFYLVAFKLCRQMGFEFYDPDKTWHYAKQYLKTRKIKSKDEELQISLMHLSVYLQYMYAQGKQKTFEPILLQEFATLEKQIEGKNLPKANYQLHCTLAWYHTHYTNNSEQIITHLKHALSQYEECADLFMEFDRVYVIRALAEANLNASNYTAAFQLYSELWNRHYALVHTNYYHLGLYHDTVLIIGNYEAAEQLLKEIFDLSLKFEIVVSPRMGAYFQYAKYYLLHHKPEEALEYVNEGFALNDKNIMVLDELNLRMLQIACFIQLKDYNTATQLIARHSKFLRLKKLHTPDTDFSKMFKALKMLNNYKQTNKIKLNDYRELTSVFQLGKNKIWGLILDKISGD
ncbi:MAG TPA: hypothetical protein PL084_01975 [Chitinophagales bacterium]|nr:hypothetical protein [Chitinophagales bacterium]HRP38480.1 hypothetical protein [Chitinophagales bacterium]